MGFTLFAAAFVCVLPARSAPPLEGVPKAIEERGNVFVTAWSTLIRDLDVIPASGVHPGLMDAWFESMPDFVARDVLRAGNSPAVLVAAARRLAVHGGRSSARLIAKTAQRPLGELVREALTAAALKAGHLEVTQRVEQDFRSANVVRKIFAARVLAAADKPKGLQALRSLSKRTAPGAAAAVRALGRLGGAGERRRLERLAVRRGPGSPASTALCEWKTRMLLPDVYRVLELRDSSGSRQAVVGGMYDTWYAILAHLVDTSPSTRDPVRLAAAIDDVDPSIAAELDPEVFKRRCAALQNVLASVSARRRDTSARPRWPSTFEQARAWLTKPMAGDSPDAFASRVTAAIALMAQLGEELGYPGLDGPETRLMGLSPGASRVLDGDFDTAWHGAFGEKLTLTTSNPLRVRAVQVALGCPDGAPVQVTGFALEAKDHRGKVIWTKAGKVSSRNSYYQSVDLGEVRLLERFSVSLEGIDGPVPPCLKELRLVSPRN